MSDLLRRDAGVRVSMPECNRIQPSGEGLTRTRQGVSSQDKSGPFSRELKYLQGVL